MLTIRPVKGGTPPVGAAGGDLSGEYPNPTVTSISGQPFSDIDAQNGQVLTWDGTSWVPGTTAATGTGGGNRNVALEGGVSQTLLPGSIIKLMWINPGNGQAYWLQTEKIVTST